MAYQSQTPWVTANLSSPSLLPLLVKDELFTDDVKLGLLRPLYLLTLEPVVLRASGAR